MTDLVLHIGSPKTGTTTLQACLAANSERLRQAGVYYPYPADPTLKQELMISAAIRPPQFWPRVFKLKPGEDPGPLQAMAQAFFADIRARRGTGELTVVSSEHIAGLQARKIPELLDICGATSESVAVVGYVREPIKYWLSAMSQRLKGSTKVPTPFGGPGGFHVAEQLRRWTSVVGKDSLIVRVFDRRQLVGTNVCNDFLAVLATLHPLPPVSNFDLPADQNVSMSAEELVLLQELREDWLRLPNNQFSPASRMLVSSVTKHAANHDTTTPRLSARTEHAFYARIADDLAWLRDNHGIEFPECQNWQAGANSDEEALAVLDRGRTREILDGFDAGICTAIRSAVGQELGYPD